LKPSGKTSFQPKFAPVWGYGLTAGETINTSYTIIFKTVKRK